MDKGQDIECTELCAVAHAALNGRPDLLSGFLARALGKIAAGSSTTRQFSELEALVRSLRLTIDHSSGPRTARWLESPGHALVILGDPAYPALLAAIPQPPPVLFTCGNTSLLGMKQIAVVGSRRASTAGRENAYTLARGLTAAGLAITSGMAIGIDAAAHAGALDESGATVAVFGCGIDRIYPATHRDLARAIEASGLLVSEYPLGYPPAKHTFPRRNRIISGLAVGTLVVEAALTSGSLITAMQALEQGREVFAVPGPIRSPLSRGCHALIRQGAVLTESVDDVLNELSLGLGLTLQPAETTPLGLALRERKVLEACEFEALSFDAIVDGSGLTAPEVSSILTALEMKGWVHSDRGGTFVRTARNSA